MYHLVFGPTVVGYAIKEKVIVGAQVSDLSDHMSTSSGQQQGASALAWQHVTRLRKSPSGVLVDHGKHHLRMYVCVPDTPFVRRALKLT